MGMAGMDASSKHLRERRCPAASPKSHAWPEEIGVGRAAGVCHMRLVGSCARELQLVGVIASDISNQSEVPIQIVRKVRAASVSPAGRGLD